LAVAAAAAGCAGPFTDKNDRDLRRSIRLSTERELAEARELPELQRLIREDRVSQLRIPPAILEQLEHDAGPNSYAGAELSLGKDLYGRPQHVARVTLERAVASNVKRNLNIEFARLAPAISQQQYVAADAAFDWVLFANVQYNYTNEPRSDSASIGGFTGVTTDRREVTDITAGLRKPLIAGGTLSLQTEFQNAAVKTPGLSTLPNPAREANFVIQLDQPLLRGFGSDQALSQVRLARNAELDSIAQLKATLLQNVSDTEKAYWDLVKARWDLLIIQRLFARGQDVLDTLRARAAFDSRPATISDAASAVESRRADVIRAQRVLRDASDKLKVLMNDPEFPVGSETLVLPADGPIDQAIEFSVVDAVNSAFASRPEIQRALLSLDNTSIRQTVADSGRLPKLDFRALTRFSGLGNHVGTPYSQLGEADFIDYQVGLMFEQPIGNRAAESLYRQRRLERMQAVIAYANTIQGIVSEVKTQLRDVQTNFTLIEYTKANRIAAAENLRALNVDLETVEKLDPQNLNLKLQRQQGLAAAEQQEISSLVDYNKSIAGLYSATGTALERNRIQFSVPGAKPSRETPDLFPDFPLEPERPTAEEIKAK
jgi:outer membrane protein TolC